MSDKMRPIPFWKMLDWILEEYQKDRSIFGVPAEKFHFPRSRKSLELFGQPLSLPLGPAAGPHTQLAQNIVASYLAGGRFIELKTVQILDQLEFPKPCIAAGEECYNTEWSTELAIEEALEEYIKAWFLLHILQRELGQNSQRDFVFNMSVSYDLQGIQSPKVDSFIEGLKDASTLALWKEYQSILRENARRFQSIDEEYIESISPYLCNSITLSTMHGCPPAEIEGISKYLLREKKLHTFIKMNPTLLGYQYVQETFDRMGYDQIQIKEESFTRDLQYRDGADMLERLKKFARNEGQEFGVKLSNTLPVIITGNQLPGDEMYMSGKALYPLTINLALKLAGEFDGDLPISYSGGADFFNLPGLLETGIRPVTVASTLLKSGGYLRLKQLSEVAEEALVQGLPAKINLEKLGELAERVFSDPNHIKEKRVFSRRKLDKKLPLTDCFISPCVNGCPIHQDIPEYIRLVGEGRFQEAYQVIISKNPLPMITGTICNHRCTTKCTRLDYEQSVRIREMKRIAAKKGADACLREMETPPVTNGAKVAVIGAGPAGLAAGYFLAKAGLQVVVFDKRDRAGGTVGYLIPSFRISRDDIEKDVELIKRAGVKFRLGVEEDLSLDQLQSQGFRYVFLAIGAGQVNPLSLEGRQLPSAVGFLAQYNRDPRSISLGARVAVIGGGNTAIDAARAALRVPGVEKVMIIYRRTEEYMPADKEELEQALAEGVLFQELLTPVSWQGGRLLCQKMRLGESDATGRRRPLAIEGEQVEFAVDTVLAATGGTVDTNTLEIMGLETDETGQVQVNRETLETSRENVYIGGDALSGPSTVVEVIAHATRVALAITSKEKLSLDLKRPEISWEKAGRLQEVSAKKGRLRGPEEGIEEAFRCLECGFVCNICVEVCPNRANVPLKIERATGDSLNQILHVDGMCNECGNCATFCPYQGAPYREKLTLYWHGEDFISSSNPGMLLVEEKGEPALKIRLNGKMSMIRLAKDGSMDFPADPKIASLLAGIFRKYRYLVSL